jgi:hypothetical protein
MPKRVGKAKRELWKALTRLPQNDLPKKIRNPSWVYSSPIIIIGKDEYEKMFLIKSSDEIKNGIDAELMATLTLKKLPWK